MYGGGNMRKGPAGPTIPQPTASEMQAKEKLTQYVYEYLVQNNYAKSAEIFKQEVLPNAAVQVSEAPGFLTTWFSLFWDLYSGDPERRDKCTPTQEAKAFHDFGFVQGSMNGIRQPNFMGPPMQMGPPGSEGMMPSFYRPNMPPHYANRPPGPPQSFPNGPPNGPMFANPNDPMRGIPQNRMRMPPPQNQFVQRPPRYGVPPYMDNPTSAGFQMNGGPMHPPPHEMQHDPRYMMGGPPTSMPQYMGGEHMQQQQNMTPTTSGPPMGIGSMPPPEVSHGGTTLPPLNAANQQLGNIMNGEDIKQSPSHMMQHHNGTPGSMNPPGSHPLLGHGGGPGSAAGPAPQSVQSQPGQPGSNIPVSQPPQNHGNPQQSVNVSQQNQMMEHNMMDFSDNRTPNNHEDLTEIKKIREGLLQDFEEPTPN